MGDTKNWQLLSETPVVVVVVVVHTVEGTRMSVQARTCRARNSDGSTGSQFHHVAESITTPYPAAKKVPGVRRTQETNPRAKKKVG